MNEIKEIINQTSAYIEVVFDKIENLLNELYKLNGFDGNKLKVVLEDLSNIEEFINFINNSSELLFSNDLMELGMKNLISAIKTNNYLLICDTLEYEIKSAISNYYDVLN